MYEYIQLDNNSDYQQYAPYDIVAINESFYKLYDRKNRVFLLKDLTVLPMDIAFHCPAGTTWKEALKNGDWQEIVTPLVRRAGPFHSFIHNSIKDEYLKRSNGELIWSSQFVYEVIVNKHRVKLTNKNYMDFVPRKMMAIHSDGEIIDEYGGWFSMGVFSSVVLQAVFSNYTDFTFKRDETFFHTGLGTGMWVDCSIAEAFAVEADKVYYCDGIVNFDGTLRMQVWKLHPVWRELVWGVLDSKKSK